MEEINLYDLIRFYLRRWLTILIFIMLGAIIGIGYTYYIQQPQYKSTATLLLIGAQRTSAQESVVLNNYVELFKSRRVLEPVISEQGYTDAYSTLVDKTTAENAKNTDIINVSITTQDSNTSKALLEAAITKFKAESSKLYGDNSIKINVVDAADAPSSPTNMNPLLQIGLAVISALLISLIALYITFDYQSTRKPTKVRKTKKTKAKSKQA